MTTATPTLVLDYAPNRPRSRVRQWILAAVLLLIAGLAIAYRGAISTQAQIRFREWQCAHLSLPADQVVYSSVPEDVNRLKSDPRYILVPGATTNRTADAVLLRTQSCWQEWNKLTPSLSGPMNRPVVFFQPMTSPGGRQVTVAIVWSGSTQHSFVYERKSLFANPQKLRSTCQASTYYLVREQSGQLRVYPPYADKTNASRLVIPVEVAGKRMDLPGQLKDDGVMVITVPKLGS
ncbi:MAG: hypothetical protein ABSH20_18305 [Tepidisphaeraceae bacterium]|jgi:hypothetical protein